jgi:hypothetical protein
VFKGRQEAYSPEGEGVRDERDAVQKLLEVWGIFQKLKHNARMPLPWDEQELPKETAFINWRVAALQGLPPNALGPHLELQQHAQSYMENAGLPYDPPQTYAYVDPARAKKIAEEYHKMEHNPGDPNVQKSYQAMINETKAQYDHLVQNGYKFEFYPDQDPYPKGPRQAIEDVRNNKHLYVYPTSAGFGSSDNEYGDHPLLQDSGEQWNGQPVTHNDIFRAVHDTFGHAKEGVGFRHDGEENAWRQHAAMYSDMAKPAMTAETRGQNSWVNFGPHGEWNQQANQEQTVYADQKAGLLPEWVHRDGAHEKHSSQQWKVGDRVWVLAMGKGHSGVITNLLPNNYYEVAWDEHEGSSALPGDNLYSMDAPIGMVPDTLPESFSSEMDRWIPFVVRVSDGYRTVNIAKHQNTFHSELIDEIEPDHQWGDSAWYLGYITPKGEIVARFTSDEIPEDIQKSVQKALTRSSKIAGENWSLKNYGPPEWDGDERFSRPFGYFNNELHVGRRGEFHSELLSDAGFWDDDDEGAIDIDEWNSANFGRYDDEGNVMLFGEPTKEDFDWIREQLRLSPADSDIEEEEDPNPWESGDMY